LHNLVKTVASVFLLLFAAACGSTQDEIASLSEAGECRMAERLIKQEYSTQKQQYNLAMLYIECDGEKSKGLKSLKLLAASEYMPAMAKLIELNAANSQLVKRYRVLKCHDEIDNQFYNRQQKISSIARQWTFAGAKNGSGGLGRAGTEADIWSDIEQSKLATWRNNEKKLCKANNTSPQTLPPPFYELGNSSNSSGTSKTSRDNAVELELDNRCIQDGGTRWCYDRQSQRYGNY